MKPSASVEVIRGHTTPVPLASQGDVRPPEPGRTPHHVGMRRAMGAILGGLGLIALTDGAVC
jgi:hypothetical protein